MYLYLRKQFGFNEINFSLFNTYTMVIMLIGMSHTHGGGVYELLIVSLFLNVKKYLITGSLFSLGILSRLLKINDALIGLIATSFDIATAFGFLLVTQYKYLLYGKYVEKYNSKNLTTYL